jgi:hypothetical protein
MQLTVELATDYSLQANQGDFENDREEKMAGS